MRLSRSVHLTLVTLVILAGGLIVGACGSTDSDTTIRVNEDEWSLKPDAVTTAVGAVVFKVVNMGKDEHELVVLRTSLSPNELKMQVDQDKVDEEASGERVGEIEDVGPGETKTATFELTAGRYVLLCNIPGHFTSGMVAALEVK